MMELFQTSLFGYSKKGVHAYISAMNEDFSQKLLEKDKTYKDTIQTLREELEKLRRENEQLRTERQDVAGALIDAKVFAADLMEQAVETDRAQRAKNAELRQAELRQIQSLAQRIDSLRETFRSVLCSMDDEMEQYGMKCQAVQAEFCPDRPADTGEAPRQEARGGQDAPC